MALAAVMAVCAVACVVGLVVDPRTILGAPAWAKPLKFSLSIGLYAVTWAWLIAHLPRRRVLAGRLGTVIAATLLVEQVLIVWAVATGTTSHFNVSDGLHVVVWGTMAVAITVMYLCTFVTSLMLVGLRFPTPALTIAVRAGALIALGGIGVAFLMTGPTGAQIASPTGIVGAHAVGVVDGGPGLALLGWSTVGGDYRVAHFVGMHALQALPLAALLLGALGRRVPLLASPVAQLRLVLVTAVAYGAATVLLAVQASLGQSVVHPAGAVAVAAWTIAGAAVAVAAVVVARGGRGARGAPGGPSSRMRSLPGRRPAPRSTGGDRVRRRRRRSVREARRGPA
ncbi:hypothetical protein [Frigoribacterium sp. CFBP 8754]|uniref:hypothetical protein n=1 Tax=Frigoribacterium sp. CFBP 8754 TaxID=2775290 RepID=UPI001FCE7392|nr:hypothetical protein [Frigoribacterium sp. CFBP 8754]